jgi:hypothetical protein
MFDLFQTALEILQHSRVPALDLQQTPRQALRGAIQVYRGLYLLLAALLLLCAACLRLQYAAELGWSGGLACGLTGLCAAATLFGVIRHPAVLAAGLPRLGLLLLAGSIFVLLQFFSAGAPIPHFLPAVWIFMIIFLPVLSFIYLLLSFQARRALAALPYLDLIPDEIPASPS